MKIKPIETQGVAHYAYLVAEGSSVLVVDPCRDIELYLSAAAELGGKITHIVETHRHEDFVMGSSALARRTQAQIVNGDHATFGHGDMRLADGQTFTVGKLLVTALHTPGHTPESMCYTISSPENENRPLCVFTGDSLFFGTTGRTDLPDANKSVENAALLFDSVHAKLGSLPDTTVVLPAHGPGSVCGSGMAERPWSTIGDEKQYNDVFTQSREEFAQKKGGENLPRPPFFRFMEKVNLEGGLEPINNQGRVRLLNADEFSESVGNKILIDTREPEGFAGGHIPKSLSVWLGGLPVFGGWVSDEKDSIFLVTDRTEDVETAAAHLSRIGIDNVDGAVAGGFSEWRKSGHPIASAGTIVPKELNENRASFQVLDVREHDEFCAGHIKNALHCYVGSLAENVDELDLDRDRPVVVTCGVGHRAGLALSILKKAGFSDVRNLLGGMSAWKALQLSIEG